jgi:hypothetical protein
MMLLAACCCAGMIPLSFAFVCSCLALCSCIRTDREKSEIVRYNAPATTCAFFCFGPFVLCSSNCIVFF